MAFVTPGTPNLADFLTFAQAQGVPAGEIPAANGTQFQPQWALDDAIDRVIGQNTVAQSSQIMRYVMAVYNLALHEWIMQGDDIFPLTFFATQRAQYNVFAFVPGVINSAGDQGTAGGITVPDALKGLTLADLELIKTPWGMRYAQYAQRYGPNIVVMV